MNGISNFFSINVKYLFRPVPSVGAGIFEITFYIKDSSWPPAEVRRVQLSPETGLGVLTNLSP